MPSAEGWSTPPRKPPSPIQTPIQLPPQQPAAPDYEKLAELIVQKMAGDPRFKGKDGQNGTNGTNGQDGQPGKDAVVDYDKLAGEVATKLPLYVMQFTDANGQVVEERPFQFNKANNRFEVKIDPIHVQNFDSDSKLVDEEKYPYPGPIKLRHGAKVPATGPAT